MTRQEIVLPKLGESIVEATIIQWFKKEGDSIAMDEPLLEVSTDKVNSEIPSPFAGIVDHIVASVGETIAIGEVLAVIRAEAPQEASREQLSPAVLTLAQEQGISMETLRKIPGSGSDGRVTRRDVIQYLEGEKKVSYGKSEERISFDPMRKEIAHNVVKSFYEAPHASLIYEIDCTNMIRYLEAYKREGNPQKITMTAVFLQGISRTILRYPMLNASIEGTTIILKKSVNLGVAVHVDGGLLVPVIRECEQRSLLDIVACLGDLVYKARHHTLRPEEVREGTMTLTNFGMAGATIGVPIIRYPEVAIIGIGRVEKKLVVQDDLSIVIRDKVYVTLTFDHRIIDGIYGCQFLDAFKQYIEHYSVDTV